MVAAEREYGCHLLLLSSTGWDLGVLAPQPDIRSQKTLRRWKVLGRGQNHEALVYLHGFNCGLMDACKGLAQFLALANLPPHVGPFLMLT